MASSCKKGYYFCNSSQKCKRIPRGHKVQSDGELVREYVSDWRSDLQEVTKEYIDKKQSQFKKDYGIESNPLNIPSIQKSNNEKLAKHKLGGRSFEMTGDGQNINLGKWGADKAKDISKAATDRTDKVTKTATDSKYKAGLKSAGTNADEIKKGADEFKSNVKKGGEEAAWIVRRAINKHTPGTPEHQTVGVEKDIAFNTAKAKADAKKGRFQNKVVSNEELQGGVSVEPYTKDTKFLEVETVDIIKPKALNASDWRSELVQIDEKYKYLRGGNPKNLAAPKNKDIKHGVTGIDYTLMVKNDKKKETVSASYEAALNDLVVEILKYDIEDLHNSGFSYEEIAEYYDVKDEVVNLNEGVVGVGLNILKQVAPKVTRFVARRAVKDSKKVVNWARKPGNWKALNKNIDKVTLPVGKALKELPARTYAAGRNFRKAVDATYNAGKALRGATTNALSSAKKNLLPAAKGRLKNVTDVGTRFSNFVDKAYSSLEKNVGQKLINRGRQDIAIRNLDKAKVNKTKEIFAKVKKLEKKGDVAGDVIDVTKTTKYKKPGDPWNWFPKKPQKQRGIPNPPVDRTNKSLNPSGGALSAIKDKGSALVAKVRNFFSKKGTKQLTGTKTPNQLSGTNVKGSLPSGSSKVTKPYSSKRELAKDWMAYNKAAQKTLNKDKAIKTANVVGSGLVGGALGYKTGQEIGKWSDSKAKGYVVDMPGYDPSDKQSPETIKKINDLTYKQMQKDKKEGPSQGDSSTINGKKVSITHSSVYGKTPKKETSKTAKSKGATKWVGVNSTWVDRHGNVIAPRMKKTTKPKKGILTPLEQELEN